MIKQICINEFNLLLKDLLKNNFSSDEIEKISEEIESSIYEFTIKESEKHGIDSNIENKNFKRIYKNKTRTIYDNLNVNSYVKNTNFLIRLINKEFDIKEIAFLSPQEINKEHWKPYLDRQNANDEFLYSRTAGIKTNEYKCGRCKKNECSYYQLQVRCSDEPMTTFINCLNCGNKWSFN